MLDLSKLTSKKGALFVFHFEEESEKAKFEKQVNLRHLQKELRNKFSKMDCDTGKGTNIHLLFNSQGSITVLDEKGFAKWESEPEKNWHHRQPSLASTITDLIELMMLSEILTKRQKSTTKYTGSTEEQFSKYMDNPRAVAVAEKAAINHNCDICIALTEDCPRRQKSFDVTLFEKAIAEYQPEPAGK